MSIAAKTPSEQAAGGPSRSRGPSGASARVAGASPLGNAGGASRRISASLSPGVTVSFIRGATFGCGIGAIGSGSTLGVDWIETAPYDWDPVSSGTMRVLPNAQSAAGPKAGSETSGPAAEGHEDESPSYGGSGRREGDEDMANSNIKDSVGYQLGELNGKTEGLQEGLKELTKRVDELTKRVDNGFERQTQATNELRQEVKSDREKQTQEFNDRFDRIMGALWKLGAAIVVVIIGAAATDFFAGFFLGGG